MKRKPQQDKFGAFDPEKMTILDIRILKAQIDSPFNFDQSMVVGYSFNCEIAPALDNELRLAVAEFELQVKTKSSSTDTLEATGYFKFAFVFRIENMHELAYFNEEGVPQKVSGDLGNAITSVTVSTSRGILLTRFRGTALENFILPVISPNKFMRDGKLSINMWTNEK